jgi:hypothetical protein
VKRQGLECVDLLNNWLDILTTFVYRLSKTPGSLTSRKTKGLSWSVMAHLDLVVCAVTVQYSQLQSVLCGKLLVCGNLRAAVQRNSLRSYPTVIIELCNVMHIVEFTAVTTEWKYCSQNCKCVKIEDC